jgi:hypothetical protein
VNKSQKFSSIAGAPVSIRGKIRESGPIKERSVTAARVEEAVLFTRLRNTVKSSHPAPIATARNGVFLALQRSIGLYVIGFYDVILQAIDLFLTPAGQLSSRLLRNADFVARDGDQAPATGANKRSSAGQILGCGEG